LNINRVLWSCAEDALQSLGKSTMYTVVWQINKMDVDTTPDNFDIQKFAVALQSLFGEGSETIMNLIYKNLCMQLEVKAELDQAPAIERINKILEARKMNY
jgi:hypothetical protein